MGPLSDSDRALVAELLNGERSEGEPEVMARLRASPALRAELAALRLLAEDLSAKGAERREEIEQARAQVSAGDVERARQAMTAWRGHQPLATPRRRLPWLGLAAAVLIAALAFAYLRSTGPGRPNDRLGGGDTEIQAVRGADGRVLQLAWPSASMLAGGTFQLRLSAAVDGRPSGDAFLVTETKSRSWELTPEAMQRFEREPTVYCELLSVDAFRESEEILGTLVLRSAR